MLSSKSRDSDNGLILQEEDSSFGIGITTGVLFTFLYILYWTTSVETRQRAFLFSIITLVLAVTGYLLAFSRFRVKLIFYEDHLEYQPFIGRRKHWKYEEIAQVSTTKHAFFLYNLRFKRILTFEADLKAHPEAASFFQRKGVEISEYKRK